MRGAYDAGVSYYRDNQVTMYGSTFQSLTDGNMGFPPAELRADGKVYAINTDKWIITANAIEAYNAGERVAALEETFQQTENPELVYAVTDAEGRLLLGLTAEGRPYFPKNETYRVESNAEWLAAWLDAAGHVLFGIRQDGSTYVAKSEFQDTLSRIESLLTESGVDGTNLKAAIAALEAEMKPLSETFNFISNEEWAHAVVDAEGRLLLGIKADTGEVVMPQQDTYRVESNAEWLAVWLDTAGHVLFGIRQDGTFYAAKHEFGGDGADVEAEIASINESLAQLGTELSALQDTVAGLETGSEALDMLEVTDDPEGRTELTLDAEGKVLSYRDKDGVRHEEAGMSASVLHLTEKGMSDFQRALIESGFNPTTPVDWSDSSFIQIPEPRFALVNVSGIDAMPTSKTDDLHAWLEFWDMQGNYFKKRVIANAQGSSSMSFIKKNAAFDFCDDEWEGDETPNIRIGDWVPQDSFHMKAYYTDFFRGVGPCCYKLYEQIVRTRGNLYDRPWKKALIDGSKIGTTTKSLGNPYVGNYELLTDTGARCFPDGFPVACYLNGDFYGIFSWQLKKHRDNYHLDKKTPEHVHLDGAVSFFNGRENISWTQFEVRNPKDLYAIGGNEYDSDKAMEELAGEAEVNAWIESGQLPDGTEITEKIEERLRNTAKVKGYIENLADAIPAIKSAMSVYEASEKTEEDMKAFRAVYEAYFDPDNQIDYMIVSDLIKNSDGFGKNIQWFTYDGAKWYAGLYDCDMAFGATFTGDHITDVMTSHVHASTGYPNGYVVKYYEQEMQARYKSLADKGVISAENIFGIVKEWTMRIGTSFFEEEYDRWPDSPCIADSVVREEYWELQTDEDGQPMISGSETFDATKAYAIGETVSFGLNGTMGYYVFKCVKETSSLASNTPHTVSPYSPFSQFKHCDNLYRVEQWIAKNTDNMDELYGYTRQSNQ